MEGRGYKPRKAAACRDWEQPSVYNQEDQGDSYNHQELNSDSNPKEQETDSPQRFQKGMKPINTLILVWRDLYQTSDLQNSKIINVYCFKPCNV